MPRMWVRILLLPETKNGHWEGPLHRCFPGGPTGSEWKSNDVKLNQTCRKTEQTKMKKKTQKKNLYFFVSHHLGPFFASHQCNSVAHGTDLGKEVNNLLWSFLGSYTNTSGAKR